MILTLCQKEEAGDDNFKIQDNDDRNTGTGTIRSCLRGNSVQHKPTMFVADFAVSTASLFCQPGTRKVQMKQQWMHNAMLNCTQHPCVHPWEYTPNGLKLSFLDTKTAWERTVHVTS